MTKLIFFLLVSWISIVHGFTQRTDAAGQLDSYPAPTPLANFKWKIYNPLSESSRFAIITHFISNNYSVVVPQEIQNIKVTKINRNAFFRCGEMSQIVFPETLNDIGSSAFNRCYRLRRIVIPNGVSIIRESTFFKCSNLKEVILPDTINTIKEYAFSKCENLKTVKFLGDAPLNVPNVFKGSQPILYRAKDSTGWEKLWSGRSVLVKSEKN